MINLRTTVFNTLLLAMLSLPITGCATTVGQQFRDIMAEIDAQCKKDKMGPYLDEKDPDSLRKKYVTDCDILKIKPADPLAMEEGRFAYSIKLPAPHGTPKVKYQSGMSAESYFKELCEKEEGDFVFRTVDGVEGIKIMRPQPQIGSIPLWEEYGWLSPGYFVAPINGIYEYVDAIELVPGTKTVTQLVHYYVDPKLPYKVPPFGLGHYTVKESNARYGYTFRKSPLENRELGIVGDEIIIQDLKTNEVLAFRRRFSRLKFLQPHSVLPMQSTPCRLLPSKDSNDNFTATVLKPVAKTKGEKK